MPENYQQAAKAWSERAVAHGAEIERLHHALRKIDENAKDGQDGSANYAFDRLTQIRKIVAAVLKD